jgi:asparagine synthase (glutamine-hydrolysing)
LDEAPEEGRSAGGLALHRYWSYRDVVRDGLADQVEDEADAIEQLEEALAQSVRQQSFADVPVGAFLSGGVDSSTIVALYQKYSSIPVRTFSIGFEDTAFNEADQAKAIAGHLGTIHHEQYVTAQQARDVIPLLPSMYDEPFADSSQIPTHLVSRFAREHVTVALTGDGGDELFAGYNRHVVAPRLWRQLRKVPKPLRAAAGVPLSRLSPRFWGGAAGLMSLRRQPYLGTKIRKAVGVAATANGVEDIYRSLTEEWPSGQSPVLGLDGEMPPAALAIEGAPDAIRMMYSDAVSYLPNDTLCKIDRASMAVALETRVPFLDHRVAQVAARIPLRLKIREGRGKHILRTLLRRHVPGELLDRSKTGFGVPVGEWIKGPLRAWAEDLLDPRSMRAGGWLNADLIADRWQNHINGGEDSTAAIWAVLTFEAWIREQQGNAAGARVAC